MFFIIVLTVLTGIQLLVYFTLRNFVKEKFGDSKLWKALTVYPFIVFNIPIIYIFLRNLTGFSVPQWLIEIYSPPFYIFQATVLITGLFILIGKIIKAPFASALWILKKVNATRVKVENFLSKKETKKFDRSRRAFVRTATAAVAGYAFVGSTLGYVRKNNFEITHREIKIDNLPEELKGTKLTLLSDIHSGPYMDEGMMKEYVDVINHLNSDLVLIPGDLTNSQKSEAIAFSKAFRDVKANSGVYATLGNHDYFSDPDYVSEVVGKETPVRMLRNDSSVVSINGKELLILGMEDTRGSGAKDNQTLSMYLDKTIETAKSKSEESGIVYEEIPKILLNHKPYIFREIADRNLDLMLSGHTHGGQIVLAELGELNLSLASTVSEFISGHYREGKFQMYLSRGIGTVGLPIRLNCPPEITVIKLV